MQRHSGAASAAESKRGSGSKSLRRLLIALICSVTLVASAGTASAEQMAEEAGLGVGSVLASLIYGPTKLLYATGGVVVGGLAFLFSGGDADVAGVIMTPSVRGTYVLTPSHLRGEQPIEFLGRAPQYQSDQEADRVASAPEATW